MPHIRLILQDDEGNPIPGAEERIYQLQGECETLDQIERTTEKFKREALPEIEHSLLARAQQRFVADRGEKAGPPPLRLNGKEHVRIETIHGSLEFAEQRFLLPDGSGCRYLKQTGQGLRSSGIEEFCLYYCDRLSFAEVSKLLERVSGERLLCEQTLCNWVQHKAREVSTALSWEVSASRSLPLPTFAEAVDIYDADSKEVLVSTDAIEVKAQKPTRERRRDANDTPRKEEKEKVKKRISTDLMLMQARNGSFRHLSAGLLGEGAVSLCEVARAYLRREWGENKKPLPIVAFQQTGRARFA